MSIFNIPKSLLDAVNKVLLQEHEMTKREVVAVDKKYAKQIAKHRLAANDISGHLFSSSDRLVLPVMDTEHPTKTAVESHLRNAGYQNIDYKNAKVKDSYGRDLSMGKALSRSGASKQLMNDFAAHQQTYAKQPDTSNLQVVISKHPHDVIGMSHGTNWGLRPNEEAIGETPVQSCMRFDTYQHEHHMPKELQAGTHVAWLTHKGDNEAKEPLARITLRPYDTNNSSNELKYTQFHWHIPINSEIYRYAHGVDPEDPAENLVMNMHYSTEEGNEIPHADKHYGTFVNDSDTNHITLTSRFNTPITHNDFKNFILGFTDNMDVPMHGVNTAPDEQTAVNNTNGSGSHTILVPGKKMYGEQSDQFASTVKNWTDTHFKPNPGSKYTARRGIYLDGDSPTINA